MIKMIKYMEELVRTNVEVGFEDDSFIPAGTEMVLIKEKRYASPGRIIGTLKTDARGFIETIELERKYYRN